MNGDEGLLASGRIERVVGVIDLKQGRAVHAVAGRRDQYQPVQIQSQPPADWGDPIRLVDLYLRLGIRRLYLADLDAIRNGIVQVNLLREIIEQCRRSTPILG